MFNISRDYHGSAERSGKGTAVFICVSVKDGCLQGQHGAPPFLQPPWIWKPACASWWQVRVCAREAAWCFPFAAFLSRASGSAGGKCHQLAGKPIRSCGKGNSEPCCETPLLINEFPGSSVSEWRLSVGVPEKWPCVTKQLENDRRIWSINLLNSPMKKSNLYNSTVRMPSHLVLPRP